MKRALLVALLAAFALLPAPYAGGRDVCTPCPTGGNCNVNHSAWCCAVCVSSSVPCGTTNCPWDWDTWAFSKWICNNAPSGFYGPIVGLWEDNEKECHYRPGVCLSWSTDPPLCGYGAWVTDQCGWDISFEEEGYTACP